MTIHPHRRSCSAWILGRNRFEVATWRYGDRDRQYQFDGYWTGERWVRGTRFAMTFGSDREAIAYLDANADKMSGATVTLTSF